MLLAARCRAATAITATCRCCRLCRGRGVQTPTKQWACKRGRLAASPPATAGNSGAAGSRRGARSRGPPRALRRQRGDGGQLSVKQGGAGCRCGQLSQGGQDEEGPASPRRYSTVGCVGEGGGAMAVLKTRAGVQKRPGL